MRGKLLLSGVVVVAIFILGVGSVAALELARDDDDEQPPTSAIGGRRVVDVHGIGVATGPADTAELQIVVGTGYHEKPWSGSIPPATDRAELRPVIDALVAAGISEQSVQAAPQSGGYMGPPGSLQLLVTVDASMIGRVQEHVAAATEAAAENRLEVYHVGVRYGATNCQALEDEARQAAVDDAHAQAEELAGMLDGAVGELVYVGDVPLLLPNRPFAQPFAAATCGSSGADALSTAYPPYEPGAPAEVRITSHLNLTYAVD